MDDDDQQQPIDSGEMDEGTSSRDAPCVPTMTQLRELLGLSAYTPQQAPPAEASPLLPLTALSDRIAMQARTDPRAPLRSLTFATACEANAYIVSHSGQLPSPVTPLQQPQPQPDPIQQQQQQQRDGDEEPTPTELIRIRRLADGNWIQASGGCTSFRNTLRGHLVCAQQNAMADAAGAPRKDLQQEYHSDLVAYARARHSRQCSEVTAAHARWMTIQPISINGRQERLCVNGSKCVGLALEPIAPVPSGVTGRVLKEFLTMEQRIKFAKTGEYPAVHSPCYLCLLRETGQDHYIAEIKTAVQCIPPFYNIVRARGEYKPEACLQWRVGGQTSGCIRHIRHFNLSEYHAVTLEMMHTGGMLDMLDEERAAVEALTPEERTAVVGYVEDICVQYFKEARWLSPQATSLGAEPRSTSVLCHASLPPPPGFQFFVPADRVPLDPRTKDLAASVALLTGFDVAVVQLLLGPFGTACAVVCRSLACAEHTPGMPPPTRFDLAVTATVTSQTAWTRMRLPRPLSRHATLLTVVARDGILEDTKRAIARDATVIVYLNTKRRLAASKGNRGDESTAAPSPNGGILENMQMHAQTSRQAMLQAILMAKGGVTSQSAWRLVTTEDEDFRERMKTARGVGVRVLRQMRKSIAFTLGANVIADNPRARSRSARSDATDVRVHNQKQLERILALAADYTAAHTPALRWLYAAIVRHRRVDDHTIVCDTFSETACSGDIQAAAGMVAFAFGELDPCVRIVPPPAPIADEHSIPVVRLSYPSHREAIVTWLGDPDSHAFAFAQDNAVTLDTPFVDMVASTPNLLASLMTLSQQQREQIKQLTVGNLLREFWVSMDIIKQLGIDAHIIQLCLAHQVPTWMAAAAAAADKSGDHPQSSRAADATRAMAAAILARTMVADILVARAASKPIAYRVHAFSTTHADLAMAICWGPTLADITTDAELTAPQTPAPIADRLYPADTRCQTAGETASLASLLFQCNYFRKPDAAVSNTPVQVIGKIVPRACLPRKIGSVTARACLQLRSYVQFIVSSLGLTLTGGYAHAKKRPPFKGILAAKTAIAAAEHDICTRAHEFETRSAYRMYIGSVGRLDKILDVHAGCAGGAVCSALHVADTFAGVARCTECFIAAHVIEPYKRLAFEVRNIVVVAFAGELYRALASPTSVVPNDRKLFVSDGMISAWHTIVGSMGMTAHTAVTSSPIHEAVFAEIARVVETRLVDSACMFMEVLDGCGRTTPSKLCEEYVKDLAAVLDSFGEVLIASAHDVSTHRIVERAVNEHRAASDRDKADAIKHATTVVAELLAPSYGLCLQSDRTRNHQNVVLHIIRNEVYCAAMNRRVPVHVAEEIAIKVMDDLSTAHWYTTRKSLASQSQRQQKFVARVCTDADAKTALQSKITEILLDYNISCSESNGTAATVATTAAAVPRRIIDEIATVISSTIGPVLTLGIPHIMEMIINDVRGDEGTAAKPTADEEEGSDHEEDDAEAAQSSTAASTPEGICTDVIKKAKKRWGLQKIAFAAAGAIPDNNFDATGTFFEMFPMLEPDADDHRIIQQQQQPSATATRLACAELLAMRWYIDARHVAISSSSTVNGAATPPPPFVTGRTPAESFVDAMKDYRHIVAAVALPQRAAKYPVIAHNIINTLFKHVASIVGQAREYLTATTTCTGNARLASHCIQYRLESKHTSSFVKSNLSLLQYVMRDAFVNAIGQDPTIVHAFHVHSIWFTEFIDHIVDVTDWIRSKINVHTDVCTDIIPTNAAIEEFKDSARLRKWGKHVYRIYMFNETGRMRRTLRQADTAMRNSGVVVTDGRAADGVVATGTPAHNRRKLMLEYCCADTAAHGLHTTSDGMRDFRADIDALRRFGMSDTGLAIMHRMYSSYYKFGGDVAMSKIVHSLSADDFIIASAYYAARSKAEIIQTVPIRSRGWSESLMAALCLKHTLPLAAPVPPHLYTLRVCDSCKTIVSQVAARSVYGVSVYSSYGIAVDAKGRCVCAARRGASKKRGSASRASASRNKVVFTEMEADFSEDDDDDEGTADGGAGRKRKPSGRPKRKRSDDAEDEPMEDDEGDEDEDEDDGESHSKRQCREKAVKPFAHIKSMFEWTTPCRENRTRAIPAAGAIVEFNGRYGSRTKRPVDKIRDRFAPKQPTESRLPCVLTPCCGQFTRYNPKDVGPCGYECLACSARNKSERTRPPVCVACGYPVTTATVAADLMHSGGSMHNDPVVYEPAQSVDTQTMYQLRFDAKFNAPAASSTPLALAFHVGSTVPTSRVAACSAFVFDDVMTGSVMPADLCPLCASHPAVREGRWPVLLSVLKRSALERRELADRRAIAQSGGCRAMPAKPLWTTLLARKKRYSRSSR